MFRKKKEKRKEDAGEGEIDIGVKLYPPTFDKSRQHFDKGDGPLSKYKSTLFLIKNVYQIAPFEGCIFKIICTSQGEHPLRLPLSKTLYCIPLSKTLMYQSNGQK